MDAGGVRMHVRGADGRFALRNSRPRRTTGVQTVLKRERDGVVEAGKGKQFNSRVRPGKTSP